MVWLKFMKKVIIAIRVVNLVMMKIAKECVTNY